MYEPTIVDNAAYFAHVIAGEFWRVKCFERGTGIGGYVETVIDVPHGDEEKAIQAAIRKTSWF